MTNKPHIPFKPVAEVHLACHPAMKRKRRTMKQGDIVRHKFCKTEYVIERLTSQKAEVRAILKDGLSGSTVMVLQRNLELKERDGS